MPKLEDHEIAKRCTKYETHLETISNHLSLKCAYSESIMVIARFERLELWAVGLYQAASAVTTGTSATLKRIEIKQVPHFKRYKLNFKDDELLK